MTFSETIDALIPIYEEGMKAESYGVLLLAYLQSGICMASEARLNERLRNNEEFNKYAWSGQYWFQTAFNMSKSPISEIIDICIRPRLELLKRIQKDLKEKK